jgi:transcriptional regulator with XRE-family HTH domain
VNPHPGNKPAARPREQTPTLDRTTFGHRLRAARKRFGWTLAELAERSGVSITTISRAERGQLALGYENFTALGRALDMDMNAMFAGAGVKPAQLDGPVVTRAGKGVVYRGLAIAYEFLGTTAAGKQMSPIVGTVHARQVHGPEDFVRHAGEEFAYVLSGEIDVHFDNGEVVRLGRGDSLYFDSRLGHAYVSVSRQLARIVGMTIGGERAHEVGARGAVAGAGAGDATQGQSRACSGARTGAGAFGEARGARQALNVFSLNGGKAAHPADRRLPRRWRGPY